MFSNEVDFFFIVLMYENIVISTGTLENEIAFSSALITTLSGQKQCFAFNSS